MKNKKHAGKEKETTFSWKKINPWKVAFLFLVGILVGGGIFLYSRLTEEREILTDEVPAIVAKEGTPVLSVNSNKEQINSLIDFYLEQYQKDSDVKYHFTLENQALLTGEFKILNYPLTFYLYFDPYVTDNGNVQLKASSLSIGTLTIPIKQVMSMIEKNFKLPDWVEVNPDEHTIMIRFDQFRLQNGLFIRAEKIDLVDDTIQINLYLPKDSQKE